MLSETPIFSYPTDRFEAAFLVSSDKNPKWHMAQPFFNRFTASWGVNTLLQIYLVTIEKRQ